MKYLLAVAALLALLTGCASTATDDTGGSLAARQQAAGAPLDGFSVSVPKLALASASLVELGVNDDGSIQVPPLARPGELGVYANGPKPGQVGPAVILGHINAGGVDGAFRHLNTLQVGDEIETTAPGGAVARFVVYRTATFLKRDWPTGQIYSDVASPELRLVTCGGALDATSHNYDSNVVVWARKG